MVSIDFVPFPFSAAHITITDTVLQPPRRPVAIYKEYLNTQETSLAVYCHDRVFKRVTAVDSTGAIAFTTESKGIGSFSWRRSIKSASGTHLFDLRHPGVSPLPTRWTVESPRDDGELCLFKRSQVLQKSAFDAAVHQNVAGEGEEVQFEVLPKDKSAITTQVRCGGAVVAEIVQREANDKYRLGDLDRSVWSARVAAGMDLSLASDLLLIYSWLTGCTLTR